MSIQFDLSQLKLNILNFLFILDLIKKQILYIHGVCRLKFGTCLHWISYGLFHFKMATWDFIFSLSSQKIIYPKSKHFFLWCLANALVKKVFHEAE